MSNPLENMDLVEERPQIPVADAEEPGGDANNGLVHAVEQRIQSPRQTGSASGVGHIQNISSYGGTTNLTVVNRIYNVHGLLHHNTSGELPPQNTMFAVSEADLDNARQGKNSSRIRRHQADLVLELERIITPRQLSSLIVHLEEYFGEGELDEMNTFIDVWRELKRREEISLGSYGILETALQNVHPSHFQVIQEFKEKMENEQHVIRNSSSDEETPDGLSGRGAVSGDDTDGETIISNKLNSPVPDVKVDIIANAALMDDANVSYYIHGRKVVFANDEFHDIRPTQDIKLASTNTLAKIICSFLNNGKSGSIFYGIGKNREVFGVTLTRDQKDSFRLGVDRMMEKFVPTIFHQQHDLIYCPVVDAIGYDHTDTRRHIPDLYIIEIKLEKQTSTLYTLSDRKCYFRYGTNTVQVSTQEIRQRAILQQEARYRDEIDIMKKELIALRQTH